MRVDPGAEVDPRAWRPPVLETERLRLRPIVETDAPGVFSYASNPRVAEYTLWEAHRSVDDSMLFIREFAFRRYAEGSLDPYALESKADGRLIGTAGIFWVSKPSHHAELGYAIGEVDWGRGYAVEAGRALLDVAFGDFGIERVQARCKAENVRSRRVLEKLGMIYEGTHRSAVFHRERFWDVQMFALLRSEWPKSPAG